MVTPYHLSERYASACYPTNSNAKEGLAEWTQANRPIVNTDLVDHIPPSED